MELIPAIDLIDGRCVRLTQGDYNEKKVYEQDPLDMAKSYADCGIRRLHVVDLDGAKAGYAAAAEIVAKIAAESGMFVEIGGGIRSMETVEKYLSAGVSRVILGTAAVTDPQFLKEAVEKYGEKVAQADFLLFNLGPSCF